MLLVKQPHLIVHLRKQYDISGRDLFTDGNAFYALSEAFQRMLGDRDLLPVYFVVDALDECDQTIPGSDELIRLISASLTLSDKVRWLVSSRPEVNVLDRLKDLDTYNLDTSGTLVELDTDLLKGPVNAYIKHKLSSLKVRKDTPTMFWLWSQRKSVDKQRIFSFGWLSCLKDSRKFTDSALSRPLNRCLVACQNYTII